MMAIREKIKSQVLKYEKTRAILFDLDEVVPEQEISQCVTAALKYHKVKNLPQLGMVGFTLST